MDVARAARETKSFEILVQMNRPFRAFCCGFSILSLLFAVLTPFLPELPNRWHFFLGGLGYSALLSFIAVGLGLLPSGFRALALASVRTLKILGFAASFAMIVLARAGALSAIRLMVAPSLWALVASLVALLALAVCGWCFRFTRGSVKTV